MAEDKKPEYGLIQVEPTSRCTLRCTTCLRGSHPTLWQERDLDPALFDRLSPVFARTGGVHLQGWGEPLLHRNLTDFISRVRAEGSRASFTTNGTVMDEALARRLLDSGIDAITFSMAGAGPSTQDPLRGRGSFALLNRSLTILNRVKKQQKTKKPLLAVSYLLTPETQADILPALVLCRKWGVRLFAGVHLTHAANDQQLKMRVFQLEGQNRSGTVWKTRRRLAALQALVFRIELRLPADAPSLLPICDKNPLENLFIAADGSVSPCVFHTPPLNRKMVWLGPQSEATQKIPVRFGTLQDEDLDTIWNTPEYTDFRTRFKRRVEMYQHAMSKVGYDMDGIEQLEQARNRIRQAFRTHPPPDPCRNCTKLGGF